MKLPLFLLPLMVAAGLLPLVAQTTTTTETTTTTTGPGMTAPQAFSIARTG